MNDFDFRYDVAISFTEEQRDIAVGIQVVLEMLHIRSYFYLYDQEENLGKDLEENLKDLYANQANMVVAILSDEYFSKAYAKLEFETICKRLSADPDHFIPIKIGDVAIPASISHLTYFEWDKDPKALGEVVSERLEKREEWNLIMDPDKVATLSQSERLNMIGRYQMRPSESPKRYFALGLCHYYLKRSATDFEQASQNFKKAYEIDPRFHRAIFFYSKASIEAIGLERIQFRQLSEPINQLLTAIGMNPVSEYLEWALQIENTYYNRRGLISPFKNYLHGTR